MGVVLTRPLRLSNNAHFLWTPALLPEGQRYLTRFVLPNVKQTKTHRCGGLQQREHLFTRQPSEEVEEYVSDMPPQEQGAWDI